MKWNDTDNRLISGEHTNARTLLEPGLNKRPFGIHYRLNVETRSKGTHYHVYGALVLYNLTTGCGSTPIRVSVMETFDSIPGNLGVERQFLDPR